MSGIDKIGLGPVLLKFDKFSADDKGEITFVDEEEGEYFFMSKTTFNSLVKTYYTLDNSNKGVLTLESETPQGQ